MWTVSSMVVVLTYHLLHANLMRALFLCRSLSVSFCLYISVSLSHTNTPSLLVPAQCHIQKTPKAVLPKSCGMSLWVGKRVGVAIQQKQAFLKTLYKRILTSTHLLLEVLYVAPSTPGSSLQVPLSRVLMLSSTRRHFPVDPSLSYLRVFNSATRRLFHYILKRDDGKW